MKQASIKTMLCWMAGGGILALALLLILFVAVTGDVRLIWYGLALTGVVAGWSVLLLYLLQKRLSGFTDRLCRMLDDMLDGQTCPQVKEEETLLARISHRLQRLYSVLQKSQQQTATEKAALLSLLSDISHQSRTPIANLKMLNETMLTRQIPEKQQTEFLKATQSQLDKLEFLIEAMVKTSRLESGAITLKKERTPIEDTLAGAINGVLALLEKKQMELQVECLEGLRIPHDSRWTGEALFNLLDNAVKYTPTGGKISVKVQLQEMYLKIDITDTGRGIPEREQSAIFKRFYRERAVHQMEGIGIGLYLTREIITMQGGYVMVRSQPGKGSTFSVFLPR